MYGERRNTSGNGLVIVFVLIFIGAGVWYLDTHYGSTMTGYILLGLAIAAAIVIGWILALATMKTTLASQAEFSRHDAETDRYRQLSYREAQRGDNHWHKAHAQLSVMDAKRIDQLAQQRAGLLMDTERQRNQEASSNEWWQAPSFDDKDDE